jgi:hypothetical protein
MGRPRPWFVLAVALMPAGASADNHFADFFLGPSLTQQSALGGVQFSGSYLLGQHAASHGAGTKPLKWSLLGDISSHFVGKHEGVDVTQWTFAGGVRRTLADRHNRKYLPFAHAMIGGIHTNRGTLQGTRAAAVGGIGLDYLREPRRVTPYEGVTVLGARAQVELIVPLSGNRHAYPRFSAGMVVRVGEHVFGP